MEHEIKAQATTLAPSRRRIELARRTCVIDADRIAVRPSAGAFLLPLVGFAIGLICLALIVADVVLWRGGFPFFLLALLLFAGLLCVPLSGMGLIYASIGANVLIDRAKQSATWQQGLLGLGVGTMDLVPFWKIEAIEVREAGASEGRSTEEFAQWEIALVKKNGQALTIGRVSASRSLATPSRDRAIEVAKAVADLTGAPLRASEAASI